jgi:hypothetical protein
MKAIVRCEVCKDVILEGEQLFYDNGVEKKDDGIYGEYFEGCGDCKVCGRRLCNTCGNLINGVCISCREQEEKNDDDL